MSTTEAIQEEVSYKLHNNSGVTISFSSRKASKAQGREFAVVVKPETQGNKGLVLQQLKDTEQSEGMPVLLVTCINYVCTIVEGKKAEQQALVGSGGSRNMEAAEIILNNELQYLKFK